MKLHSLLRPVPRRGPVLGPLFAVLFLSGCGPHRLALPESIDQAYEDHGVKGYFWSLTRLTIGPYEVRNVHTKWDFTDSTSGKGSKVIHYSVRKTKRTFTVGRGADDAWRAQCMEVDSSQFTRERTAFRLNGKHSYDTTDRGRKIRYGCVFQSTVDSLWRMTLLQNVPEGGTLQETREGGPAGGSSELTEHPIRLHSVLMKGLHPIHAAPCLFIGVGSPAPAILDPKWSRIYLDRALPPERKEAMAAVLAALHIRTHSPGFKRIR